MGLAIHHRDHHGLIARLRVTAHRHLGLLLLLLLAAAAEQT